MIENLNQKAFNKFGKVFNKGFEYASQFLNQEKLKIENHNIKSKKINILSLNKTSSTLIDNIEGIALLCVSFETVEDKIKVFLLDKPVSINSNIFFKIVPLYGNCTIKIAKPHTSSLENFCLQKDYTPLGIYPKFEINKIHTLFHQSKSKNLTFGDEKHDFWELTYIDNGSMLTIVDNKKFVLNKNEFMFYDKNQYHIQRANSDSAVSFITITFDMDFNESSYLANKTFNADLEMKNLIRKIIYEKEQNLYYSEDLIICSLKEFIIKVIRNEKLEMTICNQDTLIQHKIEDSIVSKCINFIHENINTKITIPYIAKNICISPSYLSSIFKKHMNITIIDYINNYRLEKSRELIKTGKYTITEIASILGYTTVHYFSNQFKYKYGISPSAYSKSIR